MVSSSSCFAAEKRHHWWLTNRKIVHGYVRDAQSLVAQTTHDHSDNVAAALSLLDAALALCPRHEAALELKARCLLHLRRFNDVASMLLDYIPSYRLLLSEDQSPSSSDDNAWTTTAEQGTKLLPSPDEEKSGEEHQPMRCISVRELKKKILARLCKNYEENQGQEWRYLVLGQACSHLGLMEDALLLLQARKRLFVAALRRQCVRYSDDGLPFWEASQSGLLSREPSECRAVSRLLAHVKQLLRRRAAAIAAANAGAHSEAIRFFSKILDSRRNSAPQGFLADCYVHRAGAYKAAGRVADAIADCNRAVVLDSASIPALSMRAGLLESIRSVLDCLRDLERLKLLYHTILRDRKLPGPAWKQQPIRYSDVAEQSRRLTDKIDELRQRIGPGKASCEVDYHALMGLRRGCSRSELERAHLVLALRHRPDRSSNFVDRCEFVNEREADVVRDQARASGLALYRLIQRGYSTLMALMLDEEAAEIQRQRAAQAAAVVKAQARPIVETRVAGSEFGAMTDGRRVVCEALCGQLTAEAAMVFQGVSCRDVVAVGKMMSPVAFINTPIPG